MNDILINLIKDNQKIKCKSKVKVNDSSFRIISYGEHDNLIKNQYKVSQLKDICSFYKIKKTGNKEELLNRIYFYLKYSLYVRKIQKNMRGYLTRLYLKTGGILNKYKCVNDSDFCTLEDFNSIPYNQFYSFADLKGNNYGFNIVSFYNYITKFSNSCQNPYTREKLSDKIKIDLLRHIKLSRILKIDLKLKVEDDNDQIDENKKFELRVLDIFQEINSLGNYSESSWFLNLTRERMIKFIRELYDIWFYRAQLTSIVMRNIVPPHGNPFMGTGLQLIHTRTFTEIKNSALKIMNYLVKSGATNDNRSLGAYYVLASLTLVSQDARNALPWLFQSVAHNTNL